MPTPGSMYRKNGWCSRATLEEAVRSDYDGERRFLIDEVGEDMW